MKKITITIAMMMLTVLAAVTVSFADNRPKIIVQVTAGNSEKEDQFLSNRMGSVITQQGLFRLVVVNEATQNLIAKELKRQHSGPVDRNQKLAQIAKQFGAEFMCIADITSAFGMTQMTSSIVNVETAEGIAMNDSVLEVESIKDVKPAELMAMLKGALDGMTPSILRELERRDGRR